MTSDIMFTPVIILGAGRSGTNILRDVLTSLPKFETWPCDEIQPIWQHGNLGWPDDAFSSDMARPDVTAYIRNQFIKQWERSGKPDFLVEKTCANTLRVPFIDKIFPEALYIQIVRDGADVVRSAEKRWSGDLEVPSFSYFLAKARFIPVTDIPVYLWSFLSKRLGLLTGTSKQLSSWGPRFEDIDKTHVNTLQEMCAHQWAACVGSTRKHLSSIKPDRQITISYEDFIRNPQGEISQVLDLLGVKLSDGELAQAVKKVRVKTTEAKHVELENKAAEDILSAGVTNCKTGD